MSYIFTFLKFVFDHTLAAFIKADSPASIGRYMLTIEFFTMLFLYWFKNNNPPLSLTEAFYWTLGYVLFNKFVNPISDRLTKSSKPATDASANTTPE